MFKKSRRQTVFVCSSIGNFSELISEVIIAASVEDAGKIFEEKFSHKPKSILGPFFKKRVQTIETQAPIKFAGKQRQAEYDGWLVNAFTLQEPENSAFLVFIRRIDGQPKQTPKGTIIVPINNLRFL